jgi:hypothetical protein
MGLQECCILLTARIAFSNAPLEGESVLEQIFGVIDKTY